MSAPTAHRHHPWLIGTGVMLVAFNLRPPLSSVGPLLTAIGTETGMSAAGAAVLTTLPVLCLGLGSAFGPLAIRRLGIDCGVLAGMLVIAAGLGLRGVSTLPSLFAGAGLAAAGIGLVGVLLPALVKRDFPHASGVLTGLYTMMLCLGAAAGAGLTVPLGDAIGRGWGPALAAWAVPAGIALLAWAPFAQGGSAPAPVKDRPRLFAEPLAWQVTGFMGLQSSLAYIQFGWLPAVLQSGGLSALDAGYFAALTMVAQAPGALIVATLAARSRDQRGWVAGVMLASPVAFLATVFGPPALLLPAGIVLGLSVGASFGLGLTLIVLRAADTAVAGALSAMAQAVGYTIASLGPLGFGLAHDATGDWIVASLLYAGLSLAALAFGLGAGRERQIGLPTARADDAAP